MSIFSPLRGFRTIPFLSAGALLVPALLAPAGSVFAQDSKVPFAEVIDVRVVNVEVVVEENGARVRGLGPNDFELLVDGKEVPIEYFTEVEGGQAVDRTAQQDATVPALAPGAAVGTSYFIFIDDFFARPNDRDRVLNGMIEQLPNLGPEDRMAIVAFDGKAIEMLSTWTSSVPDLTRALKKAKDRTAYGLQRVAEQRLFESARDIEELRSSTRRGLSNNAGDFRRSLSLEEEQLARRVAEQVERAATAAASALRSFANPPGRKVMLLLSGGWPADPATWVTLDPYISASFSGVKRARDLYGELYDNANRLGYTIYPVDVPGLVASGIEATESSLEASQLNLDRLIERQRQEESALFEIAERTGGVALINTANVNAFERVVSDTRSYYWLGFTPEWRGDDQGHRISVELRRKGPKVRTRQGFSDLSRATEVNMMVESALLFGDPPTAEPLKIEAGRGQKQGIGKRDVPLKVYIPLSALTFLPDAEGIRAEAELRVAVLDDDGNSSEIPVVPILINGKQAAAPGQVQIFETRLRMRTKAHQLVVSIYDKVSGKILSAKTAVPAI